MNGPWAFVYRWASWACAAVAGANAAVLIWDGCTGQLQVQFRIVSLLVALLFGLIGCFVLGLERILGKILRLHGVNPGGRPEAEWVGAWRSLHVLLTIAVVLILAVMGSGLVAILSRLHQGFKIFG